MNTTRICDMNTNYKKYGELLRIIRYAYPEAAEGLKLADPSIDYTTAEWATLPWRIALVAMLESQYPLNPIPFDYFCR